LLFAISRTAFIVCVCIYIERSKFTRFENDLMSLFVVCWHRKTILCYARLLSGSELPCNFISNNFPKPKIHIPICRMIFGIFEYPRDVGVRKSQKSRDISKRRLVSRRILIKNEIDTVSTLENLAH